MCAYIDTENIPLHMPVPGTREPAQIALLNENCVTLSNHDHTTGKCLAVGRLRSGLQANRPAASTAGNVYFATDTGRFYVDTGTAWVEFITSGGQATVTGWTLIDPVIRDTLQFGPEGSGTIDATITRTAANALRVNNHLGIQVNPETTSVRAALRVGQAGAVTADPSNANVILVSNTVYDGANNKAIVDGFASFLSLSAGGVQVWTAPSATAGTNQTYSQRITLDNAGHLSVGGTPSAWRNDLKAVHVAGGGAIYGQVGNGNVYIGNNTYISASGQYTAQYAGLGGELSLVGGVLRLRTAASVAAGATQAMTERFVVDQNGTLSTTTLASIRPCHILYFSNMNSPEGQQLVLADTDNSWRGYVGLKYPGAILNLQSAHGGVEVVAGNGNIVLNPAGGYVYPVSHNTKNMGHPSIAWGTVYAVTGTIQPSHIDAKEHITALDPAACAQAVAETQWWEFDYKAPPPPEGLTDEQREAYERSVAEGATNRHQRGYVLGSPDHQTSDLFGMGDGRSASPQTDLAVVACALQDALRRIAELEARNASAA
jgi:hypothetical protein